MTRKVRKAIDRGVAALKDMVGEKGNDKPRRHHGLGHGTGGAALIGLTLLECSVPADDPAVKNLA